MAFNASGKDGEYHYLVEFALDTTTLRFADEDLSILEGNTTGFFYEGKLEPGGVISRDLGTFLEAKERYSTFSVNLDNRDGVIQTYFDTYTFANRNCDIWIGEGQSKANYSNVFPGFVIHPNAVRWDEDSASITVVDRRVKNRRTLPPNRFLTDSYPSIEEKSKNNPIPILYGNWSSAADGSLSVPAVCIDMGDPKKFKVCDHGLLGIDRYLKNASKIQIGDGIQNINLADGTFELDGIAYDSTNDIVSVNCSGLYTANNTLIENPSDILRSIYTTWMGLTATDLNVSAFGAMATGTISDHVARRYINEAITTEVLITELLAESGTDMRFVGGKYSPKFRTLDLDADRIPIRESDIVLRDINTEKADFEVEKDPDRFYGNKIVGRYRYDPVDGRYDGAYTRYLTAAVADVSAVVERPMDFNWYFDDSVTQERIDREGAQFSKETINIRFNAGPRALLLNLADQIGLTYNVFDDRAVQIRRLETDLFNMTTRISGFNLFILGVGRWTADAALDWNTSTPTQRDEQGFWCDDNGFASASDTTSEDISRYY